MGRILAAFAILLAGCAAPGSQTTTGPKGWVVLSMLQEVAFVPAYVSIRPVGMEGDSRNLGLFPLDAFAMSQFDGTWGVAKSAALKPGTYEIYNFFLEQGGTKTQYRSRQDFSLQFEVKENEVAYLGEFRATRTRTKSLVDWIQGATPYLLRSDQRLRDVAAAAKGTPELQGLSSRMAVLTPAKPTPLIRATRAE